MSKIEKGDLTGHPVESVMLDGKAKPRVGKLEAQQPTARPLPVLIPCPIPSPTNLIDLLSDA